MWRRGRARAIWGFDFPARRDGAGRVGCAAGVEVGPERVRFRVANGRRRREKFVGSSGLVALGTRSGLGGLPSAAAGREGGCASGSVGRDGKEGGRGGGAGGARRGEETDDGGGGETLLDKVVGGAGHFEEGFGGLAGQVVALDLGPESAEGLEGFEPGLDVGAGKEAGEGEEVGKGRMGLRGLMGLMGLMGPVGAMGVVGRGEEGREEGAVGGGEVGEGLLSSPGHFVRILVGSDDRGKVFVWFFLPLGAGDRAELCDRYLGRGQVYSLDAGGAGDGRAPGGLGVIERAVVDGAARGGVPV